MTRIKRGVQVKKRHKNILNQTKGYKLGRKNLFKQAKQAWIKAGQHAYRDRRNKKRVFRSLWIVNINNAVRLHELSYSQFIRGLDLADIKINRKVLAEMAVKCPSEFDAIVEKAKSALQEQNSKH